MGETVDATDRISKLPTFIIHHIMSYLCEKEVTQTSILSKRWNYLWRTFPILDFNQIYFVGTYVNEEYLLHLRDNEAFCEGLKKFTGFVDASLHRFCQLKLSLQKFGLYTSLLDVEKSSPLLDKWIGMAVESEVKELEIELISDTKAAAAYSLPQIIFSSKLLTMLKLSGFKLELPSDSLRFHSLKKLILNRVRIDEEMVQKLTSESPVLEYLCFDDFWGLKHLCVSKAPKLKIMKINAIQDEQLESVEIILPSLEDFDFLLSRKRTRHPHLIDFKCPHLKKLLFYSVDLTDQNYLHLTSQSPSLEDLSLICCFYPEYVTISSIQLQKLEVHYCYNLKGLDVDTPNLRSLDYQGINCGSLFTFPIKKGPRGLELISDAFLKFSTQWCLRLREFLERGNTIDYFRICVVGNMDSFNLDEVRESCLAFPRNIGNLVLTVRRHLPWSDYKILLEGVLWSFYPRTLSFVQTQSCSLKDQNKTFKMLYDHLNDKDAAKFCNSNGIKCWRHYLKEVKIEGFQRSEDKKLYNLDNLMKLLNTDNLMEVWPNLPKGILRFHLDWCFPDEA